MLNSFLYLSLLKVKQGGNPSARKVSLFLSAWICGFLLTGSNYFDLNCKSLYAENKIG